WAGLVGYAPKPPLRPRSLSRTDGLLGLDPEGAAHAPCQVQCVEVRAGPSGELEEALDDEAVGVGGDGVVRGPVRARGAARGRRLARRHAIVADVGDARHALVLVHARHGTVVLMLRCVVFDLETVLTPEAPDVVLEVMRRCFSRYRLGAVSTSADGNVAVKSG